MRKWVIISLISVIILAIIISMVMIFWGRNKTSDIDTTSQKELANKIEQNMEESNIQIVSTSASEEKTSPNAMISFQTYYPKCEHTTIKNTQISEELVNMSEEEIKEKYKDWVLEEFSSNYIVFKTEKDGICDEHYMLKENNGYVAIYRIDESQNETLIETTGVVTAVDSTTATAITVAPTTQPTTKAISRSCKG